MESTFKDTSHAVQGDAATRSACLAALETALAGLPSGSDWRRLGAELGQWLQAAGPVSANRAWLF